MESTIQLPAPSLSPSVPCGLYAQLDLKYRDLESRHNAQKLEMIDYKHKAHYWEAQFEKLKTREHELIDELEELKAKLHYTKSTHQTQAN